MKLASALVAMLRSKRFWIWELGGALIYALPVLVRYATGSNEIPILNFPGFWIDHLIPGNLLEKVLVNSFFPGGAGAVAGMIFASYYRTGGVWGKKLYSARLGGALGQTGLWSLLQFVGYSLMISGPGGGWNLFESVFVFPINFVLATLSIFTPDVVSYVRKWIDRLRGRGV